MFLIVTPQLAHATGPTLTFSVTSGTGDAITTGVKVSGSGFPQLTAGTGIQLYFILSSKTLGLSGATTVSLYGQSLLVLNGSTTSGTVAVDATGSFTAFFDVPTLPGGTYNAFVTYTPIGGTQTLSPATTFTIVPYLDVRLADELATTAVYPTIRAAVYGQWVRIRAYSFGASESVTVSGMPVGSNVNVQLSTDSNGDATGGLAVFAHLLGDTTGGSKTFTAVGQSSGLSATRVFSINPSIAIYHSQTSGTTVSIPAGTFNTVYLEVHGFQNGETITSVVVGGISQSVSQTAASNGDVGVGSGNHIAVSYNTISVLGNTSISVTGSTTGTVNFNARNFNVVDPFAARGATTPVGGTASSGFLNPTNANRIGIPVIASVAQTAGTAGIGLSEISGWAADSFGGNSGTGPIYNGDTVLLYLYGWNKGQTFTSMSFGGVTLTTGGPTAQSHVFNASTDAYGTNLVSFNVPASWRGAQTVTVTQSTGPTTGGVSFTVTPLATFFTWDNLDDGSGVAQFSNNAAVSQGGYFAVGGTGFGTASTTAAPGEGLTLTIGGIIMHSALTTNSTFINNNSTSLVKGSFNLTPVTTATTTKGFPDLAAGAYTVSMTGATTGDSTSGLDWSNFPLFVNTVQVVPNFELASTLNPPAGTNVLPGNTVVLQTGTTLGIHGLAPSTQYQVYLDGPTGTLLSTFTSTSSGQVPAGTQFAAPASIAGNHVVDIVLNGTSVVVGNPILVRSDNLQPQDNYGYGKLFVHLTGSVTLTPSAGGVGASITMSGSGLQSSVLYNVEISGISYASFTSTSTGAIPSGVTFTFPNLATHGSNGELGTSIIVNLLNTGTNAVDSTGIFLEQGSLQLTPTAGAVGSSVGFSANGLVATTSYNIIWDGMYNTNGLTQGETIGAFATNTQGSATGTFVVPAGAAGTVPVQLLRSNQTVGASQGGVFKLVAPPIFSVGGVVNGTGGIGTGTLTTSSSSITQVSSAQGPELTVPFTDNANVTVTGVVYAVVHNAAGQTVLYTTGTITPAAGQLATAYLVLAGLPSGTYSVTIFAVTPNGIAVSTTYTATVTV